MSQPGPIVLIRYGEPIPSTRAQVGDYSLWFQRAVQEPLGLVDMRHEAEDLPPDAAGYIVMGSPLAVYDPHPWLPRALESSRWLLECGRPVLGVCFGHQLLAVARGGEVAWNPRGVEVGTVEVELSEAAREDPLFAGFQRRLHVNASHGDTVVRLPDSNPPQVLGSSSRDGHQILRWGPQVWSVQFHPEMRAQETRLALGGRTERLISEGGDPEAVREAISEAPDGVALLSAFVSLVRSG